MRVLLVGKNPAELDQIREYLEQLPFKKFDETARLDIIGIDSCEGALEQIKKDHNKLMFFDLVITEQQMDKMTGLELANQLTKKGIAPHMPVVIYADNITEAIKQSNLPSEVVIFFELPFSFDEFKKIMEKVTSMLVSREDEKRKKSIQELMDTHGTKDFLSSLENIYMNSARNIFIYKMYAPWSHISYVSLGSIYIGCNMHEAAIPHLKTAIDINPTLKQAHRNLAMCYKKTGRALEELEELKEMLETNPDSSTVLMKVGDAYLRECDYKNAIKYLKDSIAKHKDADSSYLKAKSHVSLGKAYIKEGESTKDPSKYELAKGEFNMATSIDPTLIAAYNNLIIVYQKMGMYEEARATMAKAVQIMPTTAEGWVELFEIYLIDGEVQKAKYALQKALKFDPENQIILVTVGEIYIRHKMFTEAIEIFSNAIELNPSDTRYYNYMGICCRRLERFRLAAECYREAIRIDSDDPNLYYNLGRSYLQDNMMSAAKAAYETVLKLDPNHKDAKKGLDYIEKQTGSVASDRRKGTR